MLRTIRLTFALLFFTLITLLFLDFTGSLHAWFGWMAKIQFLPALLALNVGIIAFLLLLTFLFGRIYCSVICPLGVFQDGISWIAGKRKKNRFHYSPALTRLRYVMLGALTVALVAGATSLVALFAPYSAYGRIASNLFAPVWQWGNNLLAYAAERMDSYAFYETDVWLKSLPTFLIAIVTLIIVVVLAWRGGRTYCNTICPVGTILGTLSRHSLFKPVIDTDKCNGCGLCARNCKASCISSKAHEIDYSRCVVCMDCINKCKRGAITYAFRHPRNNKPASAPVTDMASENQQSNGLVENNSGEQVRTVNTPHQDKPAHQQAVTGSDINHSRRSFLSVSALVATTALLKAQEKTVDGGLAIIEEKKIPKRATRLTPPGSLSTRRFAQHCTACQLCVSVCPNQVLRPFTGLASLMQPEMSYERGYCRPECTKCADVCPAGAIRPITTADKSAIQIGHAVWIKENCVPLTDGVDCGNCARHCPTGAIQMVLSDPDAPDSPKIPVVNTERCIGCGACENLCPARPFSAIYVEGHTMHRTV